MTNSNNCVYLLKLGFLLFRSILFFTFYLKHFNKAQSSAPTWGAAETSQAGKKQNRLCFLGEGGRAAEKEKNCITTFFPSMTNYQNPNVSSFNKISKR